MSNRNYKQIYAIKAQNEKRILKVNPSVPHRSGIYFFTREENGFRYCYIGQAVDILRRLADHLQGYQHIDLSIRKHGFCSAGNPSGWAVNFLEFPKEQLDEKEQHYIKTYANAGYQLLNVTSGSQGVGKADIGERKPSKTYTQGVEYGYNKARKEVRHLFDLHLTYAPKKQNKLAEKAMKKFEDFLQISIDN